MSVSDHGNGDEAAPVRRRFEVRVTHHGEGIVVITPDGDLDLSTADQVEAAFRAHEGSARLMIMDLSELSFIDSSGLQLLIHQQRRSSRDGHSLVVCGGSQSIRRIFDLCGLDAAFTFVDDVAAALELDPAGPDAPR